MLRDITIGQYYDADSLIHRMDPRTKLTALLIYIIILFLIKNPLAYLPCFLVLLILFRLAKVPFGFFARGLKGITILIIFTLLFRMAYTPGETVATLWIFTITREGINKGIAMTARIVLMVTAASLLSYTSTPRQLADGMETGLAWMEKLKIPIHDMAVITMIAFRFIPIMLEELNTLMDAQAARGARFEDAGILEKCSNVIALLMPLFMSTVRKASDLAMAMEARGYTGSSRTARMYPLVYDRTDRIAYALMYLSLIGVIAAKILL